MNHEERTEQFYARGVERYGTHHGNYLSFGLWEAGIQDYVAAAEHLLKRLADKIHLDENSILLNVACGMGSETRYFMEHYRCKQIDALDLTQKHIALAQQRNSHNNVRYTRGNASTLSKYYPTPERFTHIACVEGATHFYTRTEYFAEANRLLKPRGKMGSADICLARKPKTTLEDTILKMGAKVWHYPLENAYLPDVYARNLERQGFTDINMEDVSDATFPGYMREQLNPETRKAIYPIRGQIFGRLGIFIDAFAYYLYTQGLIKYFLISAEKKERLKVLSPLRTT